MLGSNLHVPQELGPTQMPGILPPRPGLPYIESDGSGSCSPSKLHLRPPSRGEFPIGERSSSHQGRNIPHLLQYDMIAIIGFCFHCVQNKTGFFLKVLYHLITNEHMDSCWPLLVDLADLKGEMLKMHGWRLHASGASQFSWIFPVYRSRVADRVLVLWPGVRLEPLRWESRVQDIGPPETSWHQIRLNGESSPRNLHLNIETQLHSTTGKLQ